MKDTTIEDLSAALKTEQKPDGQPKALMRLHACMWRKKEGSKIDEIATRLNKPPSTIYDWLVRMNEDGLEGRYDRKKPGRPPKTGPK